MLSYINPICYKNVLHKLHGQLDFHFLMIFLKPSNELESFIFFGIKVQILETRKQKFLRISLSFRFWHIIHYAFLNHMILFR